MPTHPRAHRAVTLSLLLALAALSACAGDGGASGSSLASTSASAGASTGASATDGGAGSLPDGWTSAQAEGFSMGVPEGWLQLSADVLTDTGAIGAAASANPELATILEQVSAAIESGQILFFAIETEPADPEIPFSANVNVLSGGRTTQDVESAVAEMASGIEASLPVNGEVETEAVSHAAGDAARIRYEWTVTVTDGTAVDVAVTQYVVIADGTAYILSFSVPSAGVDEYGPLIEQMVETFDPS